MEFIVKSIDELCRKITDGAHYSPEECVDSGYAMYSSKDMLYNRFSDENVKRISVQDYERLVAQDCKPQINDIVIIKDGANYLKYAFRISERIDAVILSSIAILRPNTDIIDPDYFVYLLRTNSIRNVMSNYVSGAAIPRIVLKDFKKMKLGVISCIQKQQEIASYLLSIDNLIETNNKRIRVLEQMAENLYKEWFVRFRFPGHETVKFENGFPTTWKRAKIADLVTFQNGFAFKSEDYDEKGRYVVVTIKNVQDGYFDLDSIERIDFLPSRMPKYCMLKKGDVIMSLTGNVGRVCIVSADSCLLNQRVCRIESKYPLFAYMFFKQEAVFQLLCNIAYGTAQLNLSPILAGRMKTVLPPNELMGQFNKKVTGLFGAIQQYREQNDNLIKQRDLLLPRLMSGKLEV